ncbi:MULTISPECIES: SMC-Scp complex subunit ScpB [Bacillus]|uniref:Segregation and condensation protein B n=1 Tax=Bacillus smithii 7_3_47FAA TaxID=665952 RepID=G9QPC6_9BACI|nr:SMC-Scp complex subunit ScpB [Bacillus smithii]AKP47651.1 Segregation and condensation protein B [Bacillus smithii]EHL73919.1 segregation and condensation protein B [Bacillus smithii 7_3_47FAA]MED0658558.1 SMC-Scp complex subunit ScpB [Bacillus smithii]MED4883964.1 SMC-Scp complex subunit ScpB [Bacillus smithii]MED4926667.1 SMC-Scp complex subunit ScpB [Bacillus smithii]
MELIHWKSILESLLFAAGDEGLTLKQIADVLEIEEFEAMDIVNDLKQEYENNEQRGLQIIEWAHTFQLATKKENAPYLKKMVETARPQSLSQAALETLAIVAYKQPITKVEIEEIRGVQTERPIQTLISKGLIKEVGRKESPGRPILYGTTNEFLDYFGLKDLNELPPLRQPEEEEYQQDADLFFEKFQETLQIEE